MTAIELNLPRGGTKHVFLTLQFLTDGGRPGRAVFAASNGTAKRLVASDHVENPNYRAFTPDDHWDVVARHGLHFDHARQTCVVCHMMTALAELNSTGPTAVVDTREQARDPYERIVAVLDEEAAAALRP